MDTIEILMFVIGLFVTAVVALAAYFVGQIQEGPDQNKVEPRDRN